MFSPRALDLKSLALHRLIAEKIRREPAIFKRVHETLSRWRDETTLGKRPYFVRWQTLVDRGLDAALEIAVQDSEYAQAMRQASPFAGILTERERLDFLESWSLQRGASDPAVPKRLKEETK